MSNDKSPQQTAYQRWELASLDENEVPEKIEQNLDIAKLTQEMTAARDEAYQIGLEEGRAIGLTKGHAQGLTQGIAEGHQQIAAIGEVLSKINRQYQQEIHLAHESTASQLLELALDIAQAMLKTALPVRPELLLPVIEQAVNALPSLQLPATLYLNPLDTDLVRTALGEDLQQSGWRLLTDGNIERGGCRIETATNEIDATLTTRWRRLQQSLGQNTDWLTTP
ncbi:flagellar assembly protein FliH [Methylobacter sp. S3L5C]|uniref:flagellar assembly protein FliH n=1 Tax=Methylobacter sp. S3L5C TaxID=2839024 RepID=UPI001FAD00D9|nr:flagellar assembly protein FliH [Methylobacter sp. S3L5C]UOA09029.1 flagellar assembly protein FliH [Methylobacter sp. S3L5C]